MGGRRTALACWHRCENIYTGESVLQVFPSQERTGFSIYTQFTVTRKNLALQLVSRKQVFDMDKIESSVQPCGSSSRGLPRNAYRRERTFCQCIVVEST